MCYFPRYGHSAVAEPIPQHRLRRQSLYPQNAICSLLSSRRESREEKHEQSILVPYSFLPRASWHTATAWPFSRFPPCSRTTTSLPTITGLRSNQWTACSVAEASQEKVSKMARMRFTFVTPRSRDEPETDDV